MGEPTKSIESPNPNPTSTIAGSDGPSSGAVNLVGGYTLGEEIGRGGMGIVYRAHDVAMNREVAVKILQDKYEPDSSTAKRFVEEAQITGQLQHPGIPPIYHVGKRPDQRPFLAMKLIKGDTLEELLKSNASVNTLAIFEKIAEAVGYAHAHGVIHRDLKPANIMVGAFGEVQVMDWGLAKVLASGGRKSTDSEAATDPNATLAVGTEIKSLRDSSGSFTEYGSVMGTPSYMPPEQAAGELDKIDARADVFGLGAILCTMLTGQPPFVGKDAESIRIKAMRGKTDEAIARLDACGAEPDVVELCKQCLSFEPVDRPADGNTLAKRIAEIRKAADERAKSAELLQAKAEVQAAEQLKRRRVLTWSAAVVTVVLAAGVSASLWQAKRATDAEIATTTQLIETTKAKEDANAKTKEVQATLAVVEQRTKLAMDAYGDFVFGIQNKLENRPSTQELRIELLQYARKGITKILDNAPKQGTPDRLLMWSHLRMGDIERQLGNTLAAQKEYQAGHVMAQRLVDADPKNLSDQRDLSGSYDKLGDAMLELGQTKEALASYQKGLVVLQRLADADPKYSRLQRGLHVSFNKLGDAWLKLGQTKEALEYYQKSLAIAQRLADADPKSTNAQRDLSISFVRLGDLTVRMGQSKQALEFYQQHNAITQRLANADLKNTEAQRGLSVSFERLGEVMARLGQSNKALEFYQKSLVIVQRLVDADPKNAQTQRDLSFSHSKITLIYQHQYEFAKAAEAFAKAEQLAVRFSKPGFYEGDLPWIREQLATCRNAEKAIADLDYVFQQDHKQISELASVRVKTLLTHNHPSDALATANRFAEWAETLTQGRDRERYNAACLFVLCAAHETDREPLFEQSLSLLRLAKSNGYFDAKITAHIKQDSGFNGIRTHPRFVAFLAELEQPCELAPPPRASR